MRSTKLYFSLILPSKAQLLQNKIIVEDGVYNFKGILVKQSLRSNSKNNDSIQSIADQKLSFYIYFKSILKAIITGNIFVSANFCGVWFSHFGHFILETLYRIPINYKKNKRIIFQNYDTDSNFKTKLIYQKKILNFFNISQHDVVLCLDSPIIVLKLNIVQEEVIFPEEISNIAVEKFLLLRKIGESKISNLSQSKENVKIFLSRKKLDIFHKRIDDENLIKIENLFEKNGYKIIHPELLEFEAQFNYILNAKNIAGFRGSAMHLALFAHKNTEVIELGDLADIVGRNPIQEEICKKMNLRYTYIPYDPSIKSYDLTTIFE